jgi:hypothetical protein
MVKLKLTIELEYDADPEWYPSDDPYEMAKIVEKNLKNNPEDIIEWFDKNTVVDIKVEKAFPEVIEDWDKFLIEFAKKHKERASLPSGYYSEAGNCSFVYLKDVDYYAEWVAKDHFPLESIYREQGTDKIVGFCIIGNIFDPKVIKKKSPKEADKEKCLSCRYFYFEKQFGFDIVKCQKEIIKNPNGSTSFKDLGMCIEDVKCGPPSWCPLLESDPENIKKSP